MNKPPTLSPEAKKMIANYVRQGARMLASLIAEEKLHIQELPQNREISEFLMEKFNARFSED